MALHEVRVYDGQGNLKESFVPVVNYEGGDKIKYPSHKCTNISCETMTTKRGTCGPDCSKENKRLKSKSYKATQRRLLEKASAKDK